MYGFEAVEKTESTGGGTTGVAAAADELVDGRPSIGFTVRRSRRGDEGMAALIEDDDDEMATCGFEACRACTFEFVLEAWRACTFELLLEASPGDAAAYTPLLLLLLP